MQKRLVWLEYLGVIGIWFLIFGDLAFSHLAFVDYVSPEFLDIGKSLVMSNYTAFPVFFWGLELIARVLGILPWLFQFSILITLLISWTYIRKLAVQGNKHEAWAWLFGLIFFFNPFVYSRIMVGQIGVLLAYLLLPMYLYYVFSLIENNFSLKYLGKTALTSALAASLSLQFFAFHLLIFFVAFLWMCLYKRPVSRKQIWSVVIFLFLLMACNAYWLQGLWGNPIFSASDVRHESFFAPQPSSGIPAVAKILGMYGFWREESYLTPWQLWPAWIWYCLLAVLAFLGILGYYWSSPSSKFKSRCYYTLFWLGLLLGTGASHPYTAPVFSWFFDHLPLFNGFRDSHKFVALLALGYAGLIPEFLLAVKNKLMTSKARNVKIGILFLLFAIFIVCFTYPLIGLHHQLRPMEYPQEYTHLDTYLEQHPTSGYAIYLPWQLYLTYTWSKNSSSDGRIAVPMNRIVHRPVIIGPDEYGAENELSSSISFCLEIENLECLKEMGVSTIIKDVCTGYPENYTWINSTETFNEGCLHVYEYSSAEISSPSIPGRFILGLMISVGLVIYFLFQDILLHTLSRPGRTDTLPATYKLPRQ